MHLWPSILLCSGYMAPEYLHKGIITKKSDIFSLGVIVIEIITGRRDGPDSTGMSIPDFIENVLEKWRNRLEDSRCTSLEKGCQQISRCIEMGLNCVQFDETKRPTTKEIINCLKRHDDANLHVINEEEFATEDHDAAVDWSISDAEIAELEASMYGLQIIKNGDLEELHEFRSETFGTLYLALYYGKWRGTDVAIKRFKKSCFAGGSSEQEKFTNDFWREAKILSKLRHPNVVDFYGVVPDALGTVTEFMVNGSLRNVLLTKHR